MTSPIRHARVNYVVLGARLAIRSVLANHRASSNRQLTTPASPWPALAFSVRVSWMDRMPGPLLQAWSLPSQIAGEHHLTEPLDAFQEDSFFGNSKGLRPRCGSWQIWAGGGGQQGLGLRRRPNAAGGKPINEFSVSGRSTLQAFDSSIRSPFLVFARGSINPHECSFPGKSCYWMLHHGFWATECSFPGKTDYEQSSGGCEMTLVFFIVTFPCGSGAGVGCDR